MADLNEKLNKVRANESFPERIKRFIPGYSGYVDRDNSREIDTILRNEIAFRLEGNKRIIADAVLTLSESKRYNEIAHLKRIDKKNETAIAKFRSAARGYTGAFDVSKVKEEKLNMLYEFDLSLAETVENICNNFNELENHIGAGESINEKLREILKTLDFLIDKFTEREKYLHLI
jgi:uncharacterized protein YjgD (DUF1641 family)